MKTRQADNITKTHKMKKWLYLGPGMLTLTLLGMIFLTAVILFSQEINNYLR